MFSGYEPRLHLFVLLNLNNFMNGSFLLKKNKIIFFSGYGPSLRLIVFFFKELYDYFTIISLRRKKKKIKNYLQNLLRFFFF